MFLAPFMPQNPAVKFPTKIFIFYPV